MAQYFRIYTAKQHSIYLYKVYFCHTHIDAERREIIMQGELIRVSSLKEAFSLKDQDSAFFAGGTGICYKDSGIHAKKLIVIPEEKDFRSIIVKDEIVSIGALVSFTQALECPDVPGCLKEALRFCGSWQKRNMATVCGNIASWRCDSYLVPTLVAAGACLKVATADQEDVIGIAQYARERDLYKDALITAVLIKSDKAFASSDGNLRVISKRYANTVESHAYLTIAMGREKNEYRIAIAIKRCGIFLPDIMNWDVAWRQAGVQDDFYGSEEYKRYLTQTTLDQMYESLSTEGGDLS